MARRSASALALSFYVFGAPLWAQTPAPNPPPVAPAPKAPAAPAPKAPAAAPAPQAPTAPAAVAPKAPAVAPAPKAPPAIAPAAPPSNPPLGTVERARQGVVVLERAGRPLGLGVVLDGDGRILTALSALTHGNYVSARYHDGGVSTVKLVHGDRGWDLALLQPEMSHRKSGVRAAKSGGLEGAQVLALTPPNQVSTAPAALQLAKPLLGADGRTLTEAYELRFRAKDLGAPVVNPSGEVVALVARACPAGSGPGCVPAPYGVPVPAIKQFLRKAPTEASWLGIEAASDEAGSVRGLRVVSVAVGSPASLAGLRAGKDGDAADLIVAVDGAPVTTPAELNEAVRASVAGEELKLLLYGLGRYREVRVEPRAAPELRPQPYVPAKVHKPAPRTPNPYR